METLTSICLLRKFQALCFKEWRRQHKHMGTLTSFDFFAASIPSPMFQKMGTAYLGLLDARQYAAAASEASALESPGMSPVRITGQRPFHSRVILSGNSSAYSSSLYTDSSLNDICHICGEEDGVLLYCEGLRICSIAVHAKCLDSRQVSCMLYMLTSYVHIYYSQSSSSPGPSGGLQPFCRTSRISCHICSRLMFFSSARASTASCSKSS
jgi:hypothetical protein